MKNLEQLILSNLVRSEEYCRTVLPFLRNSYFTGAEQVLFKTITGFIIEHNKMPNETILGIELQKQETLSDDLFDASASLLKSLKETENVEKDWLLAETEKWCKDKAVFNAIMSSIEIIDGKNKEMAPDAIPSILQEALRVSFDRNVGHDYFEDAEARWEFQHSVESRIPFDLDLFNQITKGGIPPKTLNIILAGTGVGKSMMMCHHSAHYLSAGHNVLYITMEMAEERIAERIDANLLNTCLDDLPDFKKDVFTTKVANLQAKSSGKLIVKQFPTGAAHTGHFRALLNELELKKSFKPDVIMIDYLNICASSRMKMGGSINSYALIKSIAEELRGLAIEFNVPIWSATQVTRSGFTNSDIGLEDTSESFGLPATADFMFALIETEELAELNQMMVKQLKNRYDDLSKMKRFIVGIEKAKMKFYDVDDEAQGIIDTTVGGRKGKKKVEDDDIPIFDKTSVGKRLKSERKSFDDFNI